MTVTKQRKGTAAGYKDKAHKKKELNEAFVFLLHLCFMSPYLCAISSGTPKRCKICLEQYVHDHMYSYKLHKFLSFRILLYIFLIYFILIFFYHMWSGFSLCLNWGLGTVRLFLWHSCCTSLLPEYISLSSPLSLTLQVLRVYSQKSKIANTSP